jgi:hypothetical protein
MPEHKNLDGQFEATSKSLVVQNSSSDGIVSIHQSILSCDEEREPYPREDDDRVCD